MDGWWGGIEELEDIMAESLFGLSAGVETVDGCEVEPDGQCEHGFLSPLLEAGLI
ncbi:MAG: hypothetical protein V4510_13030 [bacterium]